MKKILIAIDGSENAKKAVDFAARQLAGCGNPRITLLHILPFPPAPLWDEGHIPSEQEKSAMGVQLDNWFKEEVSNSEPIYEEAVSILAGHGIEPGLIEKKSISDSTDVSASLLEEARDGGYDMLVIGRSGVEGPLRLGLGGITSKVVKDVDSVPVCVV